ncbi:PQQ-binding-like beta-propeller repeat protein [Streptomyces sp. NPDC086554]|uniref:outer membrane protein assembly factor BamB family protein n=1 Tax=Streptomyces sp. NPDC086554 TaxID=3154864 RepID=UPI003449C28A
MTTEQVEEKVRDTLRAVALGGVRAPGDLAEQVVRRRGRRRFSQAAGAATAVTAITVGAVFGFGGGGSAEPDRPVRPAASSPEGWQPWQSDTPGGSERGCLVDGSALYCAGSKYDAAKYDANTGERQWTVKVNREGDGLDHPFAVRDGVVYTYRNHTAENLPNGDYMGGTDLMAVDADNGDVLWKTEMPQDDRTGQAAMLIDGAVFVNTPSLRTMSALDPRTGDEKWRHTWDKGTVCQRAVLSGTPYLLCAPDVEKPDGTDVFRLDPATGDAEKVTTLPGRQRLMGTFGDRLVVAGAKSPADKDLVVTLISSSGEQVSHPYRINGELANSEVIGNRLITVSWKGEASVYSLTTGETLWTRPVGVKMPDKETMTGVAPPSVGIAPPVVSERQGLVYFYSPTGYLSALDLRSGERVWRDHVEPGEPKPHFGDTSQVLLYEDALVVRNGSEMVSLLPRIGD